MLGIVLHSLAILSVPHISVMILTLKLADSNNQKLKGLLYLSVKMCQSAAGLRVARGGDGSVSKPFYDNPGLDRVSSCHVRSSTSVDHACVTDH